MFGKNIPFDRINREALRLFPELVAAWLPAGRREGNEWVALNPRRGDRHPGSFKVNLRTGKWGDFATGEDGGDPISLYAYLKNLRQVEAAHELARELGVQID